MTTLCDAGAVVALINRKDKNHVRAAQALTPLEGILLTTWPCVAEAMHLLGNYGGWSAQKALWDYLEDELIEVHESNLTERLRMRALMEQYRDTPMDLADTSLVALAEAQKLTRIFTFDAHFRIYRIHGKTAFEVLP